LRVDAIPVAGAEVLEDKMLYRVFEEKANLDGKRKQVVVSSKYNPVFRLPAGDYLVRAKHGTAETEATLKVTAGELSEHRFTMDVGYLQLATRMVEGGENIEKGVLYRVLTAKKNLEGKRKQLDVSSTAEPLFRLPAGDYVITAKHGKAVTETPISVTAGEMVEMVITQNTGRIKGIALLQADGAPIDSGVFWRVYKGDANLEGKRQQVDVSSSSEPVFTLPEGDYILTVKFGEKILEKNFTIAAGEEKQVEIWAPVEFHLALAKAEQGDEFYKLQDFQPALAAYKAAADELNGLYQLVPAYVQAKISAGQDALSEGKSQLAKEAFSAAIEIEPNNFQALGGLDRANTLDEVLALSRLANSEQQQFAELDDLSLLQSAEEKLNQAIALDGQHSAIKEQLSAVKALQTDKRYRDAMTRGFQALFVSNYSNAGSGFSEALRIRPNDQTARLAYQQSLASNKTSSLQSILDRAKAFEANEDWSNALSNYQTVLQRDPNQISAKLGQIRSQARGDLDQQIRDVLGDVLLLSRSNNKDEAQRLLSEAEALPQSGPKLQAQIAELRNALSSSDASVKVQIISDTFTDVTLRKEGANQVPLGRFNNKNLVLKPGRYVLTGVRSGFRDERKEIELYPGSQDLQYFEIRCEQPIRAKLVERTDDAA